MSEAKSLREAAQHVVAEDSIPYSESVIEVRTERIIELRAALERDAEERAEIVEVLRGLEVGNLLRDPDAYEVLAGGCPVCEVVFAYGKPLDHAEGCRLAALLTRLGAKP